MSKIVRVYQYTAHDIDRWDNFIESVDVNGTFLHSHRFLDYHPKERFQDNSLLFCLGEKLIAVMSANTYTSEYEKKILFSHQGSTFGGLLIDKHFMKISYLDSIFEALDDYAKQNGFAEVVIKQSGKLFQHFDQELLDYYYYLNGYAESVEVGYYMDFNDYPEDIVSGFSSSKRRDYRYSLRNDFSFEKLTSDADVADFYKVLCDNYSKFEKVPPHSLDELLTFKNYRLTEEVSFYGVHLEQKMVAGGMLFGFSNQLLHTQYLAVDQKYTNIFTNEYLYKNLIQTARDNGYRYLSFGTATLDGGKVLNRNLAQFKEGFGTKEYVNRTYTKKYE